MTAVAHSGPTCDCFPTLSSDTCLGHLPRTVTLTWLSVSQEEPLGYSCPGLLRMCLPQPPKSDTDPGTHSRDHGRCPQAVGREHAGPRVVARRSDGRAEVRRPLGQGGLRSTDPTSSPMGDTDACEGEELTE